MESYSYNSYPDSGDSSPRSREMDFENPPPWEDPSSSHNIKVKVMCSYGGKIHPRPHDNQLSYIGGETKILAVDRNIKFNSLIAKLSALCGGDADVSFKYQLPGEDLDALISVTNDDDLEHMMHEYDRQCRASAKPARLRLFLFPPNPSPPRPSFGSDGGKSDRVDGFVEALNSGAGHVIRPEKNAKPGPASGPTIDNNSSDFLFGLERGGVVPSPLTGPAAVKAALDFPGSDRVVGSDPVSVQAQLQRLQINREQHMKPPSPQLQQQQNMYPKRGDETLIATGGGYAVVDPVQKMPAMAMAPPRTETLPPGNWIEKQQHMGYEDVEVSYEDPAAGMRDFRQRVPNPADLASYTIMPPQQQQQQNVYMRPFNGQAGQGYYVQRMGGGPEMYREQPVYNMVQMSQPQQHQPMTMVSSGVAMATDTGARYNQQPAGTMAYDSTMGRQVYYAAQGGLTQQLPGTAFQQQQGMGVGGGGMVFGGGDMRSAAGGGTSSEAAKMVTKVPQTSM